MSEPATLATVVLDLTAGSLGGMAGVVVGHPLEVIKTRMQSASSELRQLSMMECLTATKRVEGWFGFFRGVGPPLFAVAWTQGIMMATYEGSYKLAISRGAGEESSRVAAGLLSGAATCVVTVPTDAVKIQLQLERGPQGGAVVDALRCGRRMVSEHGLGSLTRGMSACLFRDVPNVALYLYAYGKIKDACLKLTGGDSASSTANFVCEGFSGGIAGCLSWAAATPADVLKTVQQEAGGRGRSLGILAAAREVHARDGLGGFLRGLGPSVVRAFPVNAVTFVVYEQLKRSFGVPSTL